MKAVNVMVALQRDQEVLEVKPQVPEKRVAIIRTLLLITGEITRSKKDSPRNGDLRVNVRIVDNDEIRIEIVGIRDGLDGMNVGEQRLHDLPLEVSRLGDQLLGVGGEAHPGLDNFHRSSIHDELHADLS